TPQGAEFNAFTGSVACPRGPPLKNVLEQVGSAAEDYASSRKAFAGHTLQAKLDDGARHLEGAGKIKAHQPLQDPGISPDELHARTGHHLPTK
ncbi:unnamed protein product, partial [Prorocentrum cordatum]